MGKSKGAVAITNYDKLIIAKIKTCCSNFRSSGFNPWRSSDLDPCRSSGGVELRSRGDRSVERQSREGCRVEKIMKGIEGRWVSEFCDT